MIFFLLQHIKTTEKYLKYFIYFIFDFFRQKHNLKSKLNHITQHEIVLLIFISIYFQTLVLSCT